VRVRVVDFTAQAPLVLQPEPGLEAVVASVGGVLFLLDLRIPLVGAVDIAVSQVPDIDRRIATAVATADLVACVFARPVAGLGTD